MTTTDAKGVTITNTYDNLNRVKTRTYSDGTPAVSYKYDKLAKAKGVLIETTNANSTSKTTQFDAFGRPLTYQQITDGETHTSSYKYNLSGALTEETYPTGRIVKNSFDANGDILRIYGRKTASAADKTYADSFKYMPDGRIEELKVGNGLWEKAKFNNRLQVTEIGLGVSTSNLNLWKINLEYGELNANGTVNTTKNTGNIAKQTITHSGQTPYVQTYKYDALYRITKAKETSGSSQNWKQNYGYDRYGNRDAFAQTIGAANLPINAASKPTVNAATNRFNSGQGYMYDKAGNVIRDADGKLFTFNGDNKQSLVKNAQGQVIGSYFYDGDGKRVKKVTQTETTIYVYSGGKKVAEYSTQRAVTASTKYVATDTLGSVRAITDQNANVVSRRDFMPFGEELYAGTPNRTTAQKYSNPDGDDVARKFTTYDRDKETGLDFAEARYYKNNHGRFTAVDPLLASGKSANPQTFNRYVYVMNNPTMYNDPLGLQASKPIGTPPPLEEPGIIEVFTVWLKDAGKYLHEVANTVGQASRYAEYTTGGSKDGSFSGSSMSPARPLTKVINPQTVPSFRQATKTMNELEPYIEKTPLLGSYYNLGKSGHEERYGDFALGLVSLGLDQSDMATLGVGGMIRRGVKEGGEQGFKHLLKNLDDDVLFHYTNKAGKDGIMNAKEFKAGLKNRVHFTQNMFTPKEAENTLFIGNPLYKGKGDFLIVFRPKSSMQFNKVGNEIIHDGSIRFNPSQIIFKGPNPFKVGSN